MNKYLAAFTPTKYEGHAPPYINASEIEPDVIRVIVRSSITDGEAYASITMSRAEWQSFVLKAVTAEARHHKETVLDKAA